MSLLDWFTNKKPPANASDAAASSALGPVAATVPQVTADDPRGSLVAAPNHEHALNRKNERLEHREHLYDVVRDAMIRVGVLGASYKFKVLSLDAHGRQFVIMMDLTDPMAGGAARLAEIEAMLAQTAKLRHDILVTAVYWRISEQVTAGLSPSAPSSAPAPVVEAPTPTPQAANPPTAPVSPTTPAPRHESPLQEEVAAFKRSLTQGAPATPLSASGKIVTTGRRKPAPPVDFEDTQLVDPEQAAPPLSRTQFGKLS